MNQIDVGVRNSDMAGDSSRSDIYCLAAAASRSSIARSGLDGSTDFAAFVKAIVASQCATKHARNEPSRLCMKASR